MTYRQHILYVNKKWALRQELNVKEIEEFSTREEALAQARYNAAGVISSIIEHGAKGGYVEHLLFPNRTFNKFIAQELLWERFPLIELGDKIEQTKTNSHIN